MKTKKIPCLFVASFVASLVDKVPDKARVKVRPLSSLFCRPFAAAALTRDKASAAGEGRISASDARKGDEKQVVVAPDVLIRRVKRQGTTHGDMRRYTSMSRWVAGEGRIRRKT